MATLRIMPRPIFLLILNALYKGFQMRYHLFLNFFETAVKIAETFLWKLAVTFQSHTTVHEVFPWKFSNLPVNTWRVDYYRLMIKLITMHNHPIFLWVKYTRPPSLWISKLSNNYFNISYEGLSVCKRLKEFEMLLSSKKHFQELWTSYGTSYDSR